LASLTGGFEPSTTNTAGTVGAASLAVPKLKGTDRQAFDDAVEKPTCHGQRLVALRAA